MALPRGVRPVDGRGTGAEAPNTMRRVTRPPSQEAARQYRVAGYWLAGRSRVAHLHAIAEGGSRTALVDDTAQWSYEMLVAAIERLGQGLHRAGVATSDAVLIVAPLRNAAAAAYLATVYHGALAVLLDRRCGHADVLHAVHRTAPRVAFAFDDDAQRLQLATHCDVVSLDRIDTRKRDAPVPEGPVVDPDAPAVILFTSGTTSAPKGVMHTINSLRCGASNMIRALEITGQDAFSLASPLAGITGVLQLHAATTTQAKIIFENRFSTRVALARIQEHHGTVIGGAPFIAESIFDEALRARRTLPLRCIAVGGSMVPQSIVDKATAFDVRPVRVYGSSEAPFSTATGISSREASQDDGVPMPGVDVALRGPDSELVVRGPHQFHGYLDPTHNDHAFLDGWVRTGDQAQIEHSRVRITGRLKELVVRKGMKISLSEIDTAATSLGDCVAFALPDAVTGERLVLAVRSTDPHAVAYDFVVNRLSAAGLAKWKLPEQIVCWQGAFPRTASGKVDRRALADGSSDHPSVYAPRLRQ